MSVKGCIYCEMGADVGRLMAPIAELRVSVLFLLFDQSFAGRCVLALKEHRNEINEMPDSERNEYFQDLSDAAKALQDVFSPDKLNYAVFGDQVPHFHIHLVPKKKNGTLWGMPYCAAAVEPVRLAEKEFMERVMTIRGRLGRIDKERKQ
jgi:ATP adenylyltransferase